MFVCIFWICNHKPSQSWLQDVVATAAQTLHSSNHCATGTRWMQTCKLQFLADYQTFSSLLPFLENTKSSNQNITILQWIGRFVMQSMNRFLLLLSKHHVGLYNRILEKMLSQLLGKRLRSIYRLKEFGLASALQLLITNMYWCLL